MQWKAIMKDILLQSIIILPLINGVIFMGEEVSSDRIFLIVVNLIFLLVITGMTVWNYYHPVLPQSFYHKNPISLSPTIEGFRERLVKRYAPDGLVIGLIIGLVPILSSTFNFSWAGLLIVVRFVSGIIEGERVVKRYNNGEFKETNK